MKNDAKSISFNARSSAGLSLPLPVGMTMGAGGKLCWGYEVNMWKNPVILFTVMNILTLVVFVVGVFVTTLVALDDSFVAGFKLLGLFLLFGLGFMLLLGSLAYLILGLVYGGRYCVLFEMNDRGVNHIQMQKQFKKAQILSLLTMLAAAAAKNVSAAGAGLLAGSTQSIYSEFTSVRKLIPQRRQHCIKVNSLFVKNQIYATPEQFDYVWDYIVQRCPQAKKPAG